jgi:hypothetical protein
MTIDLKTIIFVYIDSPFSDKNFGIEKSRALDVNE